MLEKIIQAYIEYMSNLSEINLPHLPVFASTAYYDNKYLNAIRAANADFDNVDDFDIYIDYLKRLVRR